VGISLPCEKSCAAVMAPSPLTEPDDDEDAEEDPQ
jgi:hypothetical protein